MHYKTCSRCKKSLPYGDFFRDRTSPSGRAYACKSCIKPKDRDGMYKRLYGITLEDYNRLLKAQNHSCAICGTHEDEFADNFHKKLAVDHCHTTGKIRGLLCNNCNRAIGLFADSPDRIAAAIDYLQ